MRVDCEVLPVHTSLKDSSLMHATRVMRLLPHFNID